MTVWFDSSLPSGLNSDFWIQGQHRADFSKYFFDDPFPHFKITNLLLSETFDSLCRSVRHQVSAYELLSDSDERGMKYCPLMVRSAVEFFCGPTFRETLSKTLGRSVFRPTNSVPQLRINFGPAPALPVHTDDHAPFDFATFYFVHNKWGKQSGGELCLHAREASGVLSTVTRIRPVPNTLVGMIFSSGSYHSVSQIKGQIARIAIYQEWKFSNR
jgi:hypothetical protein